MKSHLLPTFDRGLSSLLIDLDERGMLDDTLVVALGEMGRTHTAHRKLGPQSLEHIIPRRPAGGGIRRGGLYGESDKNAEYALTRPTGPEDLAATIYDSLGIDPDLRLPDAQGSPVPINEGGQVLRELLI